MVETRASSRKRKHQEEQQRAGTSEGTGRRTRSRDRKSYFENLPEESIANIIRFTSEKPCHENWKAYMSAESALALLESIPVLACCFRDMFCSLHVGPSPLSERTMMTVTVSDAYDKRKFPRLTTLLQGCLTDIKIRYSILPGSWRRSLEHNCPHLKCLSLSTASQKTRYPLPEILAAHSGSLEHFDTTKPCLRDEDISAISKFGKGLKSIGLKVEFVETKFDAIWASIGDVLEVLELREPWREGHNIDMTSITQNCRKLNKLIMECIQPESQDGMESLCKSLGDGLKSLNLTNCNVDHQRLGRILSACKHVSVELTEFEGCTADALFEIGPQANRVIIGSATVDNAGQLPISLSRAGERCKNLVGITVWNGVSEASFRAFMFHPKPLLVEFEITACYLNLNAPYIFEALANNVSSLQKFSFKARLPALSVLQKFIEGNPFLTTVSIMDYRGNFDETNAEKCDLGSAARIFLKCDNLKSFSLAFSHCHHKGTRREDYASACMQVRHRNVSVNICWYQYM